jgi:hypothetical protein
MEKLDGEKHERKRQVEKKKERGRRRVADQWRQRKGQQT